MKGHTLFSKIWTITIRDILEGEVAKKRGRAQLEYFADNERWDVDF